MKLFLVFSFFFSLAQVHAEEKIPIDKAFKKFSTNKIIDILAKDYNVVSISDDKNDKQHACLAGLKNLQEISGFVPEGWEKQIGLNTAFEGQELDFLYDKDTEDYEPILTKKGNGRLIVINSKGKVIVGGRSCLTKNKPTSIGILVEAIEGSSEALQYHKDKKVSATMLKKVLNVKVDSYTGSDIENIHELLKKSKPHNTTNDEGYFMLALRAELQRRTLDTCQNTKHKKLKAIRDAVRALDTGKQSVVEKIKRVIK